MYSLLTDIDTNRSWTLDDLSKLKAKELVPSLVYLALLMVVGVIGNAFVLIIYYFRFGPSTHRCFILVLAFYDFFACIVGAPWTIAESFYAYSYFDEVSCKIFRFILYYTCIASSLTLVLIAFERFRKICTPLKSQFSVKMAKKALFIVAGIISSLSACPAFVFYGNATIETGLNGTTGIRCFIMDTYEHELSDWPLAFNVYLLLLAFASTVSMSICYIGIARQVSKMGTENISKRIQATVRPSQCELSSCNSDLEESEIVSAYQQSKVHPNLSETPSTGSKKSEKQSSNGMKASLRNINTVRARSSKWAKKVLHRLSSSSGKKTLRVTKMLTLVTIVFVMSYLPHLTLMIWSMILGPRGQHKLPTDNVYKLLFYSFLVNNLVNPFIYAAMDLKFRRELKNLLKCKFTWKKVNC